MTVILSFSNDGYDYHFGTVGRWAIANDGHFYHHPNDGHSFLLRLCCREPSRRPWRHSPYHTANRTIADLRQIRTTGRLRIFSCIFSAVYILFQHHGGPQRIEISLTIVKCFDKIQVDY